MTGITEYHWGPLGMTVENHINGATAQADVLGIFGREALDLANLYTDGPITTTSAIANAFKMYRNYDGSKSTFGDVSVQATVPNPDNVSAFAAKRSGDGALTIIVISKYLANNTPVTINVAGFSDNGTAKVWRLNNNNTISAQPDKAVVGHVITDSLPRQTVTIYVVQPSAAAPDFSVSCNPTGLFAAPGASDGSSCSVGSVGGFNNNVTLSCGGLVAGISCSFGTNPVAPPGSSALTVNVGNAVAEATYDFTVDATDGVTTHSQNMSIVVSNGPAALLSDDFEDNNQSWTVKKGSWVEAGGLLTGTGAATAIASAPLPWFPSGQSGCSTCTLETDVAVSGGFGNKLFIQPWYQDKANRIDLILKEESDRIILKQVSGGVVVAKGKAIVTIVPGTSYHLKVGYDGANFSVDVDGVNVLTVPAGAIPNGNLWLKVKNTSASLQQVIIY